jgi:hypothetical protein
MTIYGYQKEKFDPKFLDALMTAEQLFLKDTQSYSLRGDLSSNEILSSEYKRAFIKMPESNYDGGLIFSFNEEVKKQGKDNVLFTPLLTADESRAAFDSLREDYKEKLKTEFEKREIAYDKDLINALSSRDSHRISMAIAQNGLIEKETPVILNNNVSVKMPESIATPERDDVNPEQVKRLKEFYDVQKEGATREILEKHAQGNKPAQKALEQVAYEEIDKAHARVDQTVATERQRQKTDTPLVLVNVDLDSHKHELVNYMEYMDSHSNYYSQGGDGRPRNDCSTLVGDSLALEFGKGDYPKESWAALHSVIGTKGARINSQDMIEGLIKVAGDAVVGKDMHLKGSDLERKEILLNMIKEVGHGGVIATDKGKTNSGFDVGRKWGIDHIVRVIEKDGQLYVCETTSPNGTQITPAEKWAEQKSHLRSGGVNKGLGMVENFYAVRGEDLRNAMASGDFIKDIKNRNYLLETSRAGFEDELKAFAGNNNIDPRVAAAYLKYNDSYEKFAEAVKNIDDNPAATWKKMQEYAEKQAKDLGLEYHFDKNDGLIAKIFALFGKMLADGSSKEQNMSNNAPYHAPEAKTMAQNEQPNVEKGVTENDPNITSTTIKKEVEGLDLDKLATKTDEPIKNSATPANDISPL